MITIRTYEESPAHVNHYQAIMCATAGRLLLDAAKHRERNVQSGKVEQGPEQVILSRPPTGLVGVILHGQPEFMQSIESMVIEFGSSVPKFNKDKHGDMRDAHPRNWGPEWTPPAEEVFLFAGLLREGRIGLEARLMTESLECDLRHAAGTNEAAS